MPIKLHLLLSSTLLITFTDMSFAQSVCGPLCPPDWCNGNPPKCAARRTFDGKFDIELKGLTKEELTKALKQVDSTLKNIDADK